MCCVNAAIYQGLSYAVYSDRNSEFMDCVVDSHDYSEAKPWVRERWVCVEFWEETLCFYLSSLLCSIIIIIIIFSFIL